MDDGLSPRRVPTALWILLAFGSIASAEGRLDLLPRLTASQVCPSASVCWPRDVSADQHKPPAGESGALLPPASTTQLYLRVAAGGRLELDVAPVDAVLEVVVEPNGAPAVTITPEREARAELQRLSLDLGAWTGQVVRVGLRPAARGEPVVVRAATVPAPPDVAKPAVRAAKPLNLVLYVIDTLRADHLGCYGSTRPTSPRIDAFAKSGVVFDDAIAQSSWTLPSTASILTGRTPVRHGASAVATGLRKDVPTLAERLRAQGYATAAFVSNYLVSDTFGLSRGFESFHFYAEDASRRHVVYMPSAALVRRAAHWLDHPRTRPFFLYVHSTDPHWPYWPAPRHQRAVVGRGVPLEDAAALVKAGRSYFFGREHHRERPTSMSADMVARLRTLYDGDVHAADEAFGRLLDVLAKRGLLDDTAIVLTSDHGEEFLEHQGIGHGQTLHQELLHVPLVVRIPGDARPPGTRVAASVEHVDVAPTLLQLAGAPLPSDLDGVSLIAGVADYREMHSQLDHLGTVLEAVSSPVWRAIRDRSSPSNGPAPIALFDRVRDRGEHEDVAARSPVLTEYARDLLRAETAGKKLGPAVDAERLQHLIDLGYVEDEGK